MTFTRRDGKPIGSHRQVPSPAIEGRIVKSIPPPVRHGRWRDIVEWHKENPLVVKVYERVSDSTPRYLKNTYGMCTYSRNNRNGRCDMYMHYDPAMEAVYKRTPRPPRPITGPPSTRARVDIPPPTVT